jgi:hypothetical protein
MLLVIADNEKCSEPKILRISCSMPVRYSRNTYRISLCSILILVAIANINLMLLI